MKKRSAWIVLAACLGALCGCPLERGSGKLGDSCDNNMQCAEARCSNGQMQSNGTKGICTKGCTADADCAGGKGSLVCAENPLGGGRVCLPAK